MCNLFLCNGLVVSFLHNNNSVGYFDRYASSSVLCFNSANIVAVCFHVSSDIDMKKDIETLIAEERAEIILKYATVSEAPNVCTS